MPSHDSTTSALTLNIQYHTIQGAFVQTVNARYLHQLLAIKTDFRHWIVRRIEEYGFVRELDFLFRAEKSEIGGRPEHVYILTLDMAKELCMLERSEMGRKARQYFIACEKALHGGALAKRLEDIELRLERLETDSRGQEMPVSLPEPPVTASSALPPPKPRVREHAEISLHLVQVWKTLREAETPLDNLEIMRLAGMNRRTVTAHTRYLMQLGFLEMYETFPRHLYAVSKDPALPQTAYWQRLERIREIFESRHRFSYEDLKLMGRE